jgi:tetratricopeptide (TPR) repeat protein
MKNFRKLFLASTLLTLSSSSFLGAMDNKNKDQQLSSSTSPFSSKPVSEYAKKFFERVYPVKTPNLKYNKLKIRNSILKDISKYEDVINSPKSNETEILKAQTTLLNAFFDLAILFISDHTIIYNQIMSAIFVYDEVHKSTLLKLFRSSDLLRVDVEDYYEALECLNIIIEYPNAEKINLTTWLRALAIASMLPFKMKKDQMYVDLKCEKALNYYTKFMDYYAQYINNNSKSDIPCFAEWIAVQNALGTMHLLGEGVTKNTDKGLQYLNLIDTPAAQEANIKIWLNTQFALGCHYFNEGNKEEAIRYFQIFLENSKNKDLDQIRSVAQQILQELN